MRIISITTVLFFIAFTLSPLPSQAAGKSKPKDPNTMKFQAYEFEQWNFLSPETQNLISEYFISEEGQKEVPGDVSLSTDERYELWTESKDAQAAAFFAITHALSVLHVSNGNGNNTPAIEMVERLRSAAGDRSYFTLNDSKFQQWRTAGNGDFELIMADGKIETGRFQFQASNGQGGSLHKGYDIQGSTSTLKTPRVQINYRFSDFDADIDIDGYKSFNPQHLSWENSDVRFWYDSYVKKYGYPGFKVKLRGSK